MHLAKQMKKWDRKKKKMVGVESKKAGKIRTESGKWIPATYKSDRYTQWKEKSKIDEDNNDYSQEENNNEKFGGPIQKRQPHTHWAKHNEKVRKKQVKSELKSADEILKARKIAARNKHQNMRKKKKGKGRRGNKK
ncbi:hypothetical protein HHI36_006727 [Cryptolaemus montrouzieri]|uniref:DBP10 C-terminal domain-containing protein n=1 Tax=Cryptolaemus montrouzieri TaxID=559131 RepID=A0ABD2NYC2_9CUCU